MGFLDALQSFFQSSKVDINVRFELLSEGFIGTMSKFHKARDRQNGNRIVGLKLRDPEKTELFEARFRGMKKPSEGEIAMAMKHPRIVETYEYGATTKGRTYILMEYINGYGMHTLIKHRDERLVGRRVPLIKQMAEAVEAVHEAGFIHRDICPRNYICDESMESVKLIDFGLALPNEPRFCQPGNRTGTPMYMAPEIVRRRPTDKRVDIFAFGVTAFQLLTFELPWVSGDYTGQGALQHDTEEPIPILELRPELNKTLAAAVTDCMNPNRDKRPASMELFLRRIRNVEHEDED